MGSLPALQIELLGSRAVGPGAAVSTQHGQGLQLVLPIQLAVKSKSALLVDLHSLLKPLPFFHFFPLHASRNKPDSFSRVRSAVNSCSVDAV